MGVIGFAVNAIVPHADATADVARSIVYQALTDRPRIVPYRPTGLRIKSDNVICRSDKHHSIHDDRRDFQPIGIVSMKYPLSTQATHVVHIDFRELAVASAGVVTVIRNPVFARQRRDQVLRVNVHVAEKHLTRCWVCNGPPEQERNENRVFGWHRANVLSPQSLVIFPTALPEFHLTVTCTILQY